MDDESIVGDECHIISGRSNGPRHDPALPPDRLDEPENLILLCRDLMRIVENSSAFSFDHDEPQSEAEMGLISAFLQEVQDWGELSSDLEAGDQVKTSYRMRVLLQELEEVGFWVFGAREIRRLEGGVGPPSAFTVAILKVVRSTSPEIIRMEFGGAAEVQDIKSKKATSPYTGGGERGS